MAQTVRSLLGAQRDSGVAWCAMVENVQFAVASGRSGSGILDTPSGAGAAAGLVLVHEWWGINGHVRDLAGRFAKAGFLTLAPDLYDGKIAKTAEEAGSLMQALDWSDAVARLAGAVSHLRSHRACNGRVGMVGFCMGGALTFAAACNVEGLGAAVPFYGVPAAPWNDWRKVRAPIQAHFSTHDTWAKASAARDIQRTLADLGREMELYVYDAQHAFMNDTRKDVYDAKSAEVAWGRAVAFLSRHLVAAEATPDTKRS
jgi:carboxymethylenebutenolidase